MSNTELWDKLGKTDPAHTKGFTRGGGFKGTAIKPMWSYRRMTEEFGPCGKGWGVGEPAFQTVAGPDSEILVFCTASIWYGPDRAVVYGVGGDKAVVKQSNGVRSDDEAFKKAYTDALTNALKMIGVGADVHMGLLDDSKYVNGLKEDFGQGQGGGEGKGNPRKSSASLKREDVWPELTKDIEGCGSVVSLKAVYDHWVERAKRENWSKEWVDPFEDAFDAAREQLQAMADRETDEAGDQFPGDKPSRSNAANYSSATGRA